MTDLYLDTETYNETVDIKAGTYRYAETCELMLVGYLIVDELGERGPYIWDATAEPMPVGLRRLLDDPTVTLVAHNAQFDRLVLHFTLGVALDPHRWRCTMAQALAHSLPGGIDKVGPILGVNQRAEDKSEGRKLVLKFCKPWKNHTIRRYTRENSPAEWERFKTYCRDDVADLKAIRDRLPTWNYQGVELDLWHLDQTINDRGITADLDLCHAAVKATEREKKRLAKAVQRQTLGDVEAATQRDKLIEHILEVYGVALPDMQKATLERRIEDPELPEPVRQLLALRLEATRTSTSKFKAFLKATSADGRVRGMLQFDGALRTGRWSGRIVQLQNLRSRGLPPHEVIMLAVQAILTDCADLVFADVMDIASAVIRSVLKAAPGCKLVVSDLSNIEGRKLAWLAGEEWKLNAYRAFDAGTGPDLYNVAYAGSFGIPVERVTKPQRQVGKVEELALGYEGGVGAFVAMALTYGMDLVELAEQVLSAAPATAIRESESFHQWMAKNKKTMGLAPRVFIGCDVAKRLWRESNARIASLWGELADAARTAVNTPGTTVPCRRLHLRRDGDWLRIRLPSGRFLCYPQVCVAADGQISYMGVNQYTRKWQRIKTYGGKLAENVTQAAARDCLREGMFRAEAAGYQVLLTVHDELICETPDEDRYTVDELSRLLATNAEWNQGLPLAAAGFEDYRYRKD